jgi:hypothetical protein
LIIFFFLRYRGLTHVGDKIWIRVVTVTSNIPTAAAAAGIRKTGYLNSIDARISPGVDKGAY